MPVPDDRFERLGFSRAATAITIRIIGTCPTLAFQPQGRPLIGIALFSAVANGDGYRFCTQAQALRDDALPGVLIAWLEPRLPETGAILANERDMLIPSLRGSLDPQRHPRVAALVDDPGDRVRVMPRALMKAAPRGSAGGMPCLCRAGEPCEQRIPAVFLPDPGATEAMLIREAEALWERWAQHHAAFAAAAHPARTALVALAAHRAN